jgi:D-serine deaminase-like pyridoxal phosphate-dependent protein
MRCNGVGVTAKEHRGSTMPCEPTAMKIDSLSTPALVVDGRALERNMATMASAWPGTRLRPHVKAFKSTALARELAARGHTAFCAATAREIEGLARAGLGDDLLLANELVDRSRLSAMASSGGRVTVAVDSDQTIDAAAAAGIREVLVDVNVGLPRCGCDPTDAARLADRARERGLTVRGVMGYEGHVVGLEERDAREDGTAKSMSILSRVSEEVGGDVVSGGGTGTWDLNHSITELQAGSYLLMDTAYEKLRLPFELALSVLGTVISVSRDGYAVADVGLKSLGMDHGNPSIQGHKVWFCSDEHITFAPRDGSLPRVGDRVHVYPAHIDPTVAYHETLHIVDGDDVVDKWPVDLRGW